jgi:trk system potassium uptake protein TrkH
MKWLLLCRMLGLLAMLVGGSMVFSLPWAFPVCGETAEFESDGFYGLCQAIVISVACGATLYLVGRQDQSAILRKEALAVVGLGWLLAGLLGALPFLLSGTQRHDGDNVIELTVADCVFESISGFTTTGASVLTQLEAPRPNTDGTIDSSAPAKLVPRCILFWRSFTHWLGGMGIIVLFVAILGQLGAGGKALMRREVPGPMTETVRPRIRETAVAMWLIYVGLSVVLTALLMLEGMTLYDGLCHTFGTMATGGFSTWNASLGHYNSATIEWTVTLFMVFSGTNFTLYYLVLTGGRNSDGSRKSLRVRFAPLVRDPEFRLYLVILLIATGLLFWSLLKNGHYKHTSDSIRHAAFAAVSITTTTGFGTADFDQWSDFSRALLIGLMFVGGCAGSTGGGIKVARFLLFTKILKLEVETAFRPNVVRPLRVSDVNLDKSLRHEVVVYFCLVLVIFVASWLLLAAIEPGEAWAHQESGNRTQLLDSASAVAAVLNNIGPGVGAVGPTMNYSLFAPQSKLLLSLLMLLGRLELFAILVLFVPSFWKTQ